MAAAGLTGGAGQTLLGQSVGASAPSLPPMVPFAAMPTGQAPGTGGLLTGSQGPKAPLGGGDTLRNANGGRSNTPLLGFGYLTNGQAFIPNTNDTAPTIPTGTVTPNTNTPSTTAPTGLSVAPSTTPTTTDSPLPSGPPNFMNPATGQVATTIGTPGGYNLNNNVSTNLSAFMPQGLTPGTFQNIPLTESTGPAPSTYINQYKSAAAGPTQWNVAPNQTVQGQFASLMAKGNPAIQAAEEATIRAYAASGGRNSLMAQDAAAMSGAQVALSIAAQDAQTYAAAGKYNADVANQFATQMNNFVATMISNQQSFDLGYAQLKNQFNVNMGTMYAQVVQGAAAASENITQELQKTQIQTNATIEQMDKQFAQNVANTEMDQQFANENAWTQFGMQVRGAYLSSLNTQQTALMQTIGAINSNPNITPTQANTATQSAVSQFNAFMNMNNAYYSAMTPSPTESTYQPWNPSGTPQPGVNNTVSIPS